MIAFCRHMVAIAGGLLVSTLFATACGTSDLVVGDDSRDTPDEGPPDTSTRSDTSTADSSSDAAHDATADAKADVTCPELIQPPPGFCDGGPFAPTYNGDGCISGFVCAPVLCAAAGGTCVGIAPGACPAGHTGDASKYSCGGGIGVQCCLP